MMVSLYVSLTLPMYWTCFIEAILTQRYYHVQLTNSDLDGLSIRHAKPSILRCAQTCIEQVENCVGFQFDNDTCVLLSPTEKGKEIRITIKLYLAIKPVRFKVHENLLMNSDIAPVSTPEFRPTENQEMTIANSKFTAVKPRDTRMFGGRCSENRQCDYRHGFCLDGKCACDIGYSYDFQNNTRVTRCISYGREFSAYKHSGIRECNKKTFGGLLFILNRMTNEECINKCLEEKEFVCVNVEIDFKECNLCDKTWSELDDDQTDIGTDAGFTLLYRHCYDI